MLSTMGIQVIVEKLLQSRRFKEVATKCFNVDNVHAFFNVIKAANETKINTHLHENINYRVVDEKLAVTCITPPVSQCLVPNATFSKVIR